MNLTDEGNASDYICPGFTAVTLPNQYANFRALLFPSSTRSDVVQRANGYTMLMLGVDLEEVFRLFDNRINYIIPDLFNFQTPSNLVAIAESVLNNQISTAMIGYGINNPKYLGLYQSSPMQIQALAGLIALYSSKLN